LKVISPFIYLYQTTEIHDIIKNKEKLEEHSGSHILRHGQHQQFHHSDCTVAA